MTKKIAKKTVTNKKATKKPVAKTKSKPVKKAPAKTAKKPVKATVKKQPVKASVKKAPAKLVKAAPAKKASALKAPVKVVAKPVAKPAAVAPVAAKKPVAAPASAKPAYKVGHYVVYPTHGVGKIMAEETQMIGEHELRLLVIHFEKDKMTLRVPVSRAAAAGLRPVSTAEQMKAVFGTLKQKAKISRGMWSRRAQEYETKINSGNIHSIAEVVRDLHQNVDQSERSYSERMIYENALARLVGELAAAEGTDQKVATDKLMKLLRGKVAAEQAAAAAVKEAA